MKKLINLLMIVLLIFWVYVCFVVLFPVIQTGKDLIKKVDALESSVAFIESQLQDIQDNYISHDDIQPMTDLFDDYQLEVDSIRNNINDWNSLWNQLFGYEQKQYMMRGR